MIVNDLGEKIFYHNFDWNDENNYINRKFDLNTIIKYKDQISLLHLFNNQTFSEDELDELAKSIDVMKICTFNDQITESFIKRHWDQIDKKEVFNKFSRNFLSEQFIIDHLDDILNDMRVFLDFLRYYKMSENLIEIIIEKCNNEVPADKFFWITVSSSSCLSEKFIKKYKHQVNWHDIIRYQDLSKKFIRKMKKYIDKNDYDFYLSLNNEDDDY